MLGQDDFEKLVDAARINGEVYVKVIPVPLDQFHSIRAEPPSVTRQVGAQVMDTKSRPTPFTVSQGPFARLRGLHVDKDGKVADEDGDVVGDIIQGDPRTLIGFAVGEGGDIFDGNRTLKGRARCLPQLVPAEGEHQQLLDRTLKRDANIGTLRSWSTENVAPESPQTTRPPSPEAPISATSPQRSLEDERVKQKTTLATWWKRFKPKDDMSRDGDWQRGPALSLDPNPFGLIEVHVMLPGGKSLPLKVFKRQQIKHIKKKIEKREKISADKYSLAVGTDALLDDNATIDRCGIKDQDVLRYFRSL